MLLYPQPALLSLIVVFALGLNLQAAPQVWQIGTDNSPNVLPYRPTLEFSQENNKNDLRPGKVTRLPGDPEYVAATNPTADDDFYFAGTYPVNFNGLLTPLSVPNNEPPTAWERAHTGNDRTNRVHFILDASQVGAGATFRLSFELVNAGSMIGGVVQPGFSDHDMVVRFRNGSGVTTDLFSQRVSQTTNIVLNFTAALVSATAGGNSIEIVRTGPLVSGVSYYVQYDYLRLESLPIPNLPPVFGALANASVDELVPFSRTLTATDGNLPAQTLTYSLVSGPTGLTVSGAGALEWTPTEQDGPGNFDVVVRVTDSGTPPLSATNQFSIQVQEVNATPVLAAVPLQTLVERAEWTLNLAATDGDLPANTLQFSLVEGPPGLTVTSEGFARWTPSEAQGPSSGTVTVQVTDNGVPPLSDTRQFAFGVGEVNVPPVLAEVPDVSVGVLEPLTITLVGSDEDLPANALTYGLVEGPSGMQVGPEGVLTWTPSPGQGASTNAVRVRVSDDGDPALEATRQFVVVVTESNTAPVFTPVLPQSVDELTSWTLTLSATDGDLPAQGLSYALVSGPSGLTVSPLGDMEWTPAEAQGPSTNVVRVQVIDDGVPSQSSTNEFVVVVHEVNLPPALAAVPDQTVDELTSWTLTLSATDDDLPAQGLSYALVSGPAGLTVSPLGDMEWTPTEAQGPSTNVVRVQVIDDGVPSQSSTNEFVVVVHEVNLSPVLVAVPDQAVDELTSWTLTLSATDGDLPAQGLSYALVSGPSGLTVSPFGDMEWTPTEAQGPSTNVVLVQVIDDGVPPQSSTNEFVVVVHEVNVPPALAEVSDVAVGVLELLTITLVGTDEDLPANALAYGLVEGPSGMQVSPEGVLTWTPSLGQGSSTNAVRVRVSDDGDPTLEATRQFSVVVTEANTAPVFTPVLPQSVDELTSWTLTLSATDGDLPAQGLSYALVSGPSGLTVSPLGDMEWTPTEAQGPSTNVVLVQVIDDGVPPQSSTNEFVVVVHEVNVPPVLVAIPDQSVDELTSWTLTLSATDGDLPAQGLSYALVSGPAGLTVNPLGAMEWTPTEAQGPSTNVVLVQVIDDGVPPQSSTNEFVVVVHEVNLPPALAAVPDQTVDELTSWTLTLSATDGDLPAQGLSYALVSGPSGLTVNPLGAMEWTPTEAQGPSTNVVLVQVIDDGVPPQSSTNEFVVVVHEVNVPPALAAVPDETVDELTSWTLTISATDDDLPAQGLNYSLVSGPAGLTVSPIGAMEWTPTEAQGPSTNVVLVQVIDDGVPSQSSTNEFVVVVHEVNLPPALAAVPDQTVDELTSWTLALSATDDDLPAQGLSYALVSGPSGLTVSPLGDMEWTPSEAQGPSTNVVLVQVIDDGVPPQSSTNEFVVVVHEVNLPPALAAIPDQSVDELTSWTLTLSATDGDLPAQGLSYALVSGPAGLAVSPLGEMEWTPSEAQGPSTNVVLVQVIDDGLPPQSSTNEFVVVVNEVNQPPALAEVPDQTVAELEVMTLTLVGIDEDLPANGLTYGLVNGPLGLEVSPGGVVTWTPSDAQGPSTNEVRVRVSDNGDPALEALRLFTVVVIAANSVPQLTQVGDQVVDEATALTLNLTAIDADEPMSSLIFSKVGGPDSLIISTSGLVTWTPAETDGPGTNEVVYRVTDTGIPALSATNSFAVIVREVNTAPALAPAPAQQVFLGSSAILNLVASDADVPHNQLTLEMISGPPGTVLNSAGLITWTPLSSQTPSTNLIVVAVSDDGIPSLRSTNQFTVVVSSPIAQTLWQIGIDDLPTVLPYRPSLEFSIENGKNDIRPGKVTRMPGDPDYVAASNPTADDDFYVAGTYPIGFNGLTNVLSVPFTEPAIALERALTPADRTNRIHFPLNDSQSSSGSFRLSLELVSGGSVIGSTVQPGFADHDIVIRFLNGAGTATSLFSQRISQATNVVLNFTATAVNASEGANTIEIVRTGPEGGGVFYWIQHDYLRLQSDQGILVDADGDGLSAAWEVDNYFSDGNASDAATDRDRDGLTALQEYNGGIDSTDPNKADTDRDGLPDSEERSVGSNPLVVDTDDDGLSDLAEVQNGTSPLVADSDLDGVSDFAERRLGTDPLDSAVKPTPFQGGIALNFVSSSDFNGRLGGSRLAGVVPQTLWNETVSLPSSGRPSGNTADVIYPLPGQIVRSDGTALPNVKVQWTSDGATFNGNRGSGDRVLMNGLLRASAAIPVIVTVSNVPFAQYDVYVLVGGADDGYRGRVRLGSDSATDRFFGTATSSPQAEFYEIGAGITDYRRGNFVRYTNLTQGTFTISLTNNLGAAVGIHALQIVDIQSDGDGSGIPDWWELKHGIGPGSALLAAADLDGDGLSNLQEYQRGSHPVSPDTDGDGLADNQESGANSSLWDSDGDTLSDYAEVNGEMPSNPNLIDTDADGVADGQEIRYRSDPGFNETSSPSFIGWVPRYFGSPARWEWNLENVQLVWDHGAGGLDVDQNLEDQLVTFAVRNGSSSESRSLILALRYYKGRISYTFSSSAVGGFSAPSAPGARLTDSPFGGRVVDLAPDLGFSGFGPADISDRLQFRMVAERTTGNSWNLTFLIRNQTRDETLVLRSYLNCTAAASVDAGTAVWRDADGTLDRAILEPHQGVSLYFSPTALESRPGFAAVRDTDDDGPPDVWEIANGLDPLDPADVVGDLDNDGVINRDEWLRGTDPRRPDSDGDRVPDGLEVANVSDPLNANSRPQYAGFVWPTGEDLDTNGLPDAWEIRFRAFNLPLDGDADGDGLSNSQEALWGTNPFDAQSRLALTFTPLPPDVELSWPLQPLKKQTLFWKTGSEDWMEYSLPPLTIDGVSRVLLPNRLELNPTELYRVDTQDQDFDGDGISDWAEGVIGSDPYRANSTRTALRVINGAGSVGGTVSGDYVTFVEQFRNGAPTGTQKVSRTQAARFLQQATFGPTRQDLDRLQELGLEAWLNEQIDVLQPTLHLPYIRQIAADYYGVRKDLTYSVNNMADFLNGNNVLTSFARAAVEGPDQLRQRVAFALGQILVISRRDAILANSPQSAASYHDIFVRNAFGNYYDILREVTFHPAMGWYLSAVGNQKAIPEINQYPDENYAREVQQLFTIGLWELNPDGTQILNPLGDPIATYGNREITEFARVFTGLWFGGQPWGFGGYHDHQLTVPMDMVADKHDFGSKTLLRGFVIPARSPSAANGVRDVEDALRSLLEHPNTAPFIGTQLIQFLVTSNPSTQYVARISAVFANDGTGRRGNLAAVVRAILLDPEARRAEWPAAEPGYGRLKEPVYRAMNLARVAQLGRHANLLWHNGNFYASSLQEPLLSPSVFNFFRPNFRPPGLLSENGLNGPAFQILDSYSSISFPNKLWEITEKGFISSTYAFTPDYSELMLLADDAEMLLDEVNLLFCGGGMSAATRRNLLEALEQVAPYDRLLRSQLAVYLAATCPDGAVQR